MDDDKSYIVKYFDCGAKEDIGRMGHILYSHSYHWKISGLLHVLDTIDYTNYSEARYAMN